MPCKLNFLRSRRSTRTSPSIFLFIFIYVLQQWLLLFLIVVYSLELWQGWLRWLRWLAVFFIADIADINFVCEARFLFVPEKADKVRYIDYIYFLFQRKSSQTLISTVSGNILVRRVACNIVIHIISWHYHGSWLQIL